MDREIPKEVRNKERNKKIIRYGGMGAAGIVVISVLISLMRTGVKEKDIVFSQVSTGTIEVSVSASGKVVPAFEEIINSPINTRILEVYKKGRRQRGYRHAHPEAGLTERRNRLNKQKLDRGADAQLQAEAAQA